MTTIIRTLLPSLLLVLLVACKTPPPPGPVSDEDRIQADLIGKTIGGRESSWKFEPGHIQYLKITHRINVTGTRPHKVYFFVTATLKANFDGADIFQAEIQVIYRALRDVRPDDDDRPPMVFESAGLLSLKELTKNGVPQ